MTAPSTPSPPLLLRMRLRRLRLVREFDPDWPVGDDPVLPGALEVATGDFTHLVACPDAVTLVTSLRQLQPYGARGQMIRPAQDTHQRGVRLEAVWATGSRLLGSLDQAQWDQHLASLAGQVADVLAAAGERDLLALLAPALAGTPPIGETST